MKTDEQIRALFENECDRLQEEIHAVMKPPGFETMGDEDLVVCHRAAVAALVATLSQMFLLIRNPIEREHVRLGALTVLAPIPTTVKELH